MKVQIYSASVCPYAQRTRMALLAKGVEFELTEIDLQNKPEWFRDVSPYGKVPVVKYGNDRVWESTIINEYLDEVFPEPPLMPQNPGERAIARIWIDFANTKFTPAFYKLLMSQDRQQQQEWAEELQNHLRFMEYEGLRKLGQGAYWLGDSISLVDISFYPWFERWDAIAHYRDVFIPAECDRLLQWLETLKNSEPAKATAQPGNYHIESYAKYASDRADGVTAQELRKYGK